MKTIRINEKLSKEQLAEIVKTLRSGGLVIYPTETAYGIGALAGSQAGVDKLMRYKTGRDGKAISVAVTARNMAEKYVELNDIAVELYDRYLPGPVTVISKLKKDANIVPELVPNGTLGIRVPNHVIPQQIISSLGEGITSTSANESGGKTPYKISDILENISEEQKNLIDIVIDFGELPARATSTIVDTNSNPTWILRGEGRGVKIETQAEKYTITNEQELNEITENILIKVKSDESSRNLVFLLTGELGTGKTRFVQALAQELKIEDNVISPSFVLERQYKIPNSGMLYHYDFWRLESKEMVGKEKGQILEELGVRDALKGKDDGSRNIIAIEWPDKVGDLGAFFKLIGCDVIKVSLSYGNQNNQRVIEILLSK